jgi:hypothetical protein
MACAIKRITVSASLSICSNLSGDGALYKSKREKVDVPLYPRAATDVQGQELLDNTADQSIWELAPVES